MKKIDNFVNRYPISKTLRFSLIPVGKTEENFNAKLLLEQDEKRAEEYIKVKKIIDRYHRYYIESVLSKFVLDKIQEYSELYYCKGKNDKQTEQMEKLEAEMRKSISKALTTTQVYKKLFAKELISELLPKFITEKDELESVATFDKFFTYFTGFNENRKNMYSAEPQTTAISYRCVNDNLPKFLDNAANFKKIIDVLVEDIATLNDDCSGVYGVKALDVFDVDYFSFVLSQSGIDKYNGIIGGYTCDDGTKIKGLNEYINLYNQQVAGKDKSLRLPFMKPLYKQILTEDSTVSFIPEKFENDNEVVTSVNDFYNEISSMVLPELNELFAELESFDSKGIFVRGGVAVTDISKTVFGNWSAVSEGWTQNYISQNPPKRIKSEEAFYEDIKKKFQKIKSFSVYDMQYLGKKLDNDKENPSIINYLKTAVCEKISAINDTYLDAENLLVNEYNPKISKKLCSNYKAIEQLKTLLDAIKELERIIKPLLGSGKEENKEDVFYGRFLPLYNAISSIDRLYDKVRNYVTKKPYSKDKIKLNFENSHFMSGWSQEFETKGAILFRQNENYFVGIINKKFDKKQLEELYNKVDNSNFERIVYDFQKPDNKNTPRLFIRSKGEAYAPAVEQLNLPIEEIIDIYDNGLFKTNYRDEDYNAYKKALVKIVDYFKKGFLNHDSYKHYNFRWKESSEYKDISEFYKDTMESCYELRFEKINFDYMNHLIDMGEIYLFKIHNKDFSEHSKGNPNLHTLYFKMLFDERNLKDVVYQLNGGAEMFYRKASISDDEKIVHAANQPIKNKNTLNEKAESVFSYDIIKDKRFTKRQFSLHIPITLNFKGEGQTFINNDVRIAVKEDKDTHVIGIDRGERNLLYVCVVNGKGEIVEQKSLNEIVANNGYKVNYHTLLDTKEKERDVARKSWGTVENIKELKEGYLSQVIHEICKYVVKYDAVIAMEDLNRGFKKSRFKVEKQVYQKFENMLISKLNYLVEKNAEPNQKGGLLNAYQLTNKVDGSNRGKQNGIIFYVPAWLTSKIDPITGFVDLLKPKYTSVTEAVSFAEKIEDMRFNVTENMFEFDVDFSKFPKTDAMFNKKWTIFSNSDRIETFRNSQKNNEWDNRVVNLTESFKTLFAEYNVNFYNNFKQNVINQTNKDFWVRFMKLFALTLQMRNSISGNTEVDYLISPVKDNNGEFFDSRKGISNLPYDADANGAFNIARKGLWAMELLKNTKKEEIKTVNLSISNADWLEYIQK